MFYSHTFLARKGPLGTVWCAAHLQHKLKKSHYTSTNIPSTVERIMCPEVPIALRMSGHLLLGVVRIYSKKVDYLHHDCNVLWVNLRNAFRTVDVNLPENASHAQFNAVTLPETYQLDAIDIDAHFSLADDGTQDNHLKSQEEITLQDQYPVERELYVRITFDDDITSDLSNAEASLQRDIDPMEINMPPQDPIHGSPAHQDPGPSNLSGERHERFEEGSSLPDIPDIEVMRDYHGADNFILPHDEIIPIEPNLSPKKNMPEKATDTPPLEHILAPEVQSAQSPQRSGPSSPPNVGAPLNSGSFANVTPPDLSLRSTPTPTPQQPQRRQRKRKQLFDESLVLKNEFLKNALEDCSDLVKKRKKLPCSALEMWRYRISKKKEHIFSEPLLSGLCEDLQNLSSKDLISSKPHLVLPEDSQPEPRAAASPAPVPDVGVEAERLRSPDHDPGHYRPEPISPHLTPPHSQGNAETSASPGIPGSVSEPRFGTGMESESDRGMFTGSTGLGMETPITNFEERIDYSTGALSDIPELTNPVESDELSFLEQDNNSPIDSQGPRDSENMSVRTRAVAQYLQNHSPLFKYSDRPTDELSLNSILQGRSRKLCARMFYETLVLKDYGLIDVQQDEPYGDITLKLTPTLSTAKI